MIEQADIFRIVDSAVKAINTEDSQPNPIYDKYVDMQHRVAIHADDVFPTRLFKEKAPNETPQEFNYRKDTYRSNTRQDWNRAVGLLNRLWNDQNWSLKLKEDLPIYSSTPISDYIYKDYPRGGNLIEWFKTTVTKAKANLFNGVVAVKPELKYIVNDDGSYVVDENGMYIVDDRELPKPVAYVYTPEQVIDFQDERFALIMLTEKSMIWPSRGISDPKLKKPIGLVFDFYDDTYIYRITQIGAKTDWQFRYEVYFQHNLGYVPCDKIKGIPIGKDDNNGYQLYKSIFYDAVDLLDTALYDYSTLQCSKVAHAFLERWEYVDDCPNGCANGVIHEGGESITCGTCNGKGSVSKRGVFNTIQIRTKGANISPDDMISPPGAGYVPKDAAILEFLAKDIDKTIEKAFVNANLPVAAQADGNTATEAKIDRDELIVALMMEATQLFGMLNNVLYYIGFMRYGTSYQGHSIIKPTDLAIMTAYDLTLELEKAANQPSIVKSKLEKQYLQARFSADNDELLRMFEVVEYVDTLLYMTPEAITGGILNSTVAKWQAILHNSIVSFIAQKEAENPRYLDTDLATVKTDLETMAKALASEIAPTVNADDILNRIGQTA